MFDLWAWLISGAAILAVSVLAWLVSLRRNDVSIVDSLWSLFFLLGLVVYVVVSGASGWKAILVVSLVSAWAIRLSLHIAVRNHGQPEDRRYQAIRRNNQPNFRVKSLYIVFLLQGFLAWVIGLPLFAAVYGQTPPGPLDFIGLAVWSVGMFFEVVGDYQLAKFRSEDRGEDAVLDTGLWRYTRHPNYFGEAVIWWGFYLLAVPAGGWWTFFAPVIMTFLLLRVSGVSLLEKDISQRRPAYREYIQRTNAFIPGLPGKKLPHLLAIVALVCSPVVVADSHEDSWKFRVYLDEKEIGYHDFHLAEVDGLKQVRSEAEFEYRWTFITLFDYLHQNLETWEGDCLQSIRSRTDSNGDLFSVEASTRAEALHVEAQSDQYQVTGCVMSFAYWNPRFLQQDRLINTQNGELMSVSVSTPIEEKLEVRGEERPAYRYHLSAGELNLDLWYSADDEWLALESEVTGGKKLRYVLR